MPDLPGLQLAVAVAIGLSSVVVIARIGFPAAMDASIEGPIGDIDSLDRIHQCLLFELDRGEPFFAVPAPDAGADIRFADLEGKQALRADGCLDFLVIHQFRGAAEFTILTHLLGFENRDVDDEDFRNDTVDGGEIGSGHSCTALYELRIKDDAEGILGKIAIRFKDPDSGEVTEISRKIESSDFAESFVDKECRYRLAAVAAEFAEILRESYWAKGSRMSHVLEVAHNASHDIIDDPDVVELLDLVSKASGLKQDE